MSAKPQRPRQGLTKKDLLSAYFALIGAKGGKKSRRSLDSSTAREMALKRHNKKTKGK